MLKYLSLFLIFVACHRSLKDSPSQNDPTTLSFSIANNKQRSLAMHELYSVFPKQVVEVWEPHEKKIIKFEAVELIDLLDKFYGDTWRSYDEIQFVALDGYKSGTSIEKILEHKAYLATKRLDQEEFKVDNNLQNEYIDVGPYYLIWDNKNSAALKNEGAYGWPYQVNALNLVHFSDLYPKTAPPKKASATLQEGFKYFKKYCLTCHMLKGEGGEKATELDGISGYMSQADFLKWVLDPRGQLATTTMPAMAENLQQAERIKRAKLIYDYLKVYSSLEN